MIPLDLHPDTRKLQRFSRVALFGFGLLALLTWRHPGLPLLSGGFAALALITLFLGCAHPPAVKPVYVGLTLLTFPIGYVLSHFVLITLFVLVFTPMGLFFRLIRRDVLTQTPDPASTSYWRKRPAPRLPASYYRQF